MVAKSDTAAAPTKTESRIKRVSILFFILLIQIGAECEIAAKQIIETLLVLRIIGRSQES